ncbi:MAG: type II toxin-antitoxin system HigB family toxin [Nostoc sp. NMS1]|nr:MULTISPECIES: type II toxin-antitoxin system HigB family toxin [unclassified Nostoc]MBN3905707.1 type II toxin-antitoxin system HigB family toxin [Nostoc sp. NMS1]MBN3994899.1 type II toxin-antitoxin system HigB family toxin [Nostoc sp. NMS2]
MLNYHTLINLHFKTIFIKYVLTHPEYDKERWKDDPYF